MNSKTIFSLSEYQRATLTELGITTWRQVAASDTFSDSENSELNNVINPSPPVSKENLSELTRSAVELEKNKVRSIPQHILLLLPEAHATHPLVKDVLNTLNPNSNVSIIVSQGALADFSDYLIAWELAPEITLNKTVLRTPILSQLAAPETKKQLWQILQTCNQFA